MIHCLQNYRFIKVSGNITVSIPEIKFVSKIKGDATSLILLNIQKLTTIYFCLFKVHNRYDWEIFKKPHIIFEIMGS
jgi:hypothetical protein